MATPEAITLKRAHAVQAIKTASAALAEKFGVDIPDMPTFPNQDADFVHAGQLEHFGNVLQSLAVSSKAAAKADFKVDTDFVKEAAPHVPEKVEKAAEAVETPKTPKAKSQRTRPKAKGNSKK